ncbi:MAG: hypothetical protein A3D50_02205 [Candidatus Taylorbacteria bacterium RIFCSPHIGHO2_02_FULL_44_12]|uniref:DUF86 domain-containing protein n=1 Tax=Candidatus Taylorbacteria bacterium RIFCSPHIGHO2_02_FULL_44_12 TaxID=1802308 RepID=A0A1G2MMU9_9BACT|nr:MAG: hypothetical protein A3D50_02205 [Candidatus Taylorbacteria bacterium RIFCSPHIGHO2_02_FULL_44_12]
MKQLPLKSQSIIPRIDGIEKDIKKLRELTSLPQEVFYDITQNHYDVAKLRLREALEGVFNIGAHILSRMEGGRATEYREIARKLGEHNIVDKEFALGALSRMAGYRNRLTHFYAEITPSELYDILNTNLGDFETFLTATKNVLEHPEKFDLTVE